MSGYKIRQTVRVEICYEIHKKTMPQDDFDHEINNRYWLIWDDQDKAVGFCSCRPTPLDEGCMFLSRAALLYSAQGKGLHKRMIWTRLRYAKAQGYTSAITYTHLDNIQSASNLLKAGFKLYLPEYRYVGKEFLYFIKYLG